MLSIAPLLAETKLTDNSFEGTKTETSNMLNDYNNKNTNNSNMSSKYLFQINKTTVH